MADNDSEVVKEPGAEERPTPSGSQPEPSPSIDVEALAGALGPTLEKLVEKRVQSFKDKRFDVLTDRVEDFQEQLVAYEKMIERGVSKEDALWRMDIEKRLGKSSESETLSEESPGKAEPLAAGVDTQALLNKLGLNANSPEVAKILREVADPLDQIASFAVLSRGTAAPAPNPASVQPSGGGQTTFTDADAIASRLNELYLNPSKNMAEIKRLNEQLDTMIEKR